MSDDRGQRAADPYLAARTGRRTIDHRLSNKPQPAILAFAQMLNRY